MENTKKSRIIELLKSETSGDVDGIHVTADEVEVYYHQDIPEEIDYEAIAQYIIDANS
jgi:hypothetical protein